MPLWRDHHTLAPNCRHALFLEMPPAHVFDFPPAPPGRQLTLVTLLVVFGVGTFVFWLMLSTST